MPKANLVPEYIERSNDENLFCFRDSLFPSL
jgi:hypothetical protein